MHRPWQHTAPEPGWWGLERHAGHLHMEGVDLAVLARTHGTPLHVASAARLRSRARRLTATFADYPAPVHLHFSYKTNPVAGILQVLHAEGIKAEVVSPYELHLACRLGVPGADIVLNGPNKDEALLAQALDAQVGLIVVEHGAELVRVADLARKRGLRAPVALRICPDVAPARGNTSTLTGSRKNQFGLDLPDGEVQRALELACASPHLELRGVMAHIGSGIHDLGAFARAVDVLLDVLQQARRRGAHPTLLDLGGGLGTRLSREMTTVELLTYLGTGHLPELGRPEPDDLDTRYARAVIQAVVAGCARRELPVPTLVLEPGRALVSDAQALLLTVGHVRRRPGVGVFAVTDGGAMTVSMMFLSELHAVLLASREAPASSKVSVFGSLPSPLDVVYRNLRLPPLEPGDVLAVMDAGAYFTATSTRFGGPNPGVMLIDHGEARWVRRPETWEDLARLELVLDEVQGDKVKEEPV